MRKIHIVGGGITGCSLAYFLKDKYDITLYEKDPHLGGLSRTFLSIENIPYQKGFHVLSTNHETTLSLIHEAGIKLSKINYEMAFNPLLDFKFYPFPITRKSVSDVPWHWKEAIESDLNKCTGSFGMNLKETVTNFYGNTLYDILYSGFIKKMTGLNADEIDESAWFKKWLCSFDNKTEDYYFPVNDGWNELFTYLTRNINVVFKEVNINSFSESDIIIVTGPISKFSNQPLDYIGLTFEVDSVAYNKGPDTIYYPNEVSFLAMTQYGKLFPGYEKNIITKEITHVNNGQLAYPVPTSSNIEIYNDIVHNLRQKYRHIYFSGPLATYSHMSMAEAIESARRVAAEVKHMER